MIRLILADDEELEREYLKHYIEENYKGIITIASIARDGAELLEQALMIKPDILLMDIRMPRMDGLEAAHAIRESHTDTEIVILSAYGQFSYAKQAMKLGVRDFLLKPYLDEELAQTLNKILAKMNGKNTEMNMYDNIFETVAGSIVWDMAFGKSGQKTIEKSLKRLGIESHTFKCIKLYHEDIKGLKSAGVEVIRRFFTQCAKHVIVAKRFQQLVLYLFFDEEVRNSKIRLAINKSREYIKERGEGEVLCGVSGLYTSYSEAKEAFDKAAGYIREYILLNEAEYDKQLQYIRMVSEYEDKLVFTIANADRFATETYVRDIGRIIENMAGESVEDEMRRIILGIVHKLNLKFGKRIHTEHTLLLSNLCDNEMRQNPTELLLACTEYMINAVGTGLTNGNPMIVAKAKEYIQTHYAKPLNQKCIALALGVSAGYLSKNFRIFENDSFTEYLSKIRIEEAKKMMLHTQQSITDIAYQVGFSDSGYFGKCFKRIEGISPSDYLHVIRDKK